jgi:acid stress-induced BolA-like protein IbaG/YrbA
MEKLQEKLDEILKRELKNGRTEQLETLSNGHVCGHVISTEFDNLDYTQRRHRIKGILEKHLSKDELLKISTLLTYTPDEWGVELKEL